MRNSQAIGRLAPVQGQRRIALAGLSASESVGPPLGVGTKARLRLVDGETGAICLSRFVWTIAAVMPGNHDRQAVYRLVCGNAEVSAGLGQFVVVGEARA